MVLRQDQVTWTTEGVRPKERLSFWREVVHEAVIALDIEKDDRGPFSAKLVSHTIGSIAIAHGISDGHRAVRTAANIARSGNQYFFLLCPTNGKILVEQMGRSIVLSEHECALVAADESFLIDFPTLHEIISIKVDQEMLTSRLPSIHDATSINLVQQSTTGAALAAFARSLPKSNLRQDASGRAALSHTLLDLIAISAAESVQQTKISASKKYLTREGVTAFIEAHLSDPRLSPTQAAQAFGVSERAVHAVMKATGESFMAYVRAQRLDRVAEILGMQGEWKPCITELAFDWGFGDLSTFNRAFQGRFRMSPREYLRAQAFRRKQGSTGV